MGAPAVTSYYYIMDVELCQVALLHLYTYIQTLHISYGSIYVFIY